MNKSVSTLDRPQLRGKYLWLIIAAVLLGGLAGWLLHRPQNQTAARSEANEAQGQAEKKEGTDPNSLQMDAQAQKNIGLVTAAAQTRNVTLTIQAVGSIGPNETRMASLRTLTLGRILKVNVRRGDHVRAGQALAVYDNIQLGEAVGEYGVALAALGKAKADVEVAQRSLERARNLVGLGAVAKAEADRRNAEYASAVSSMNTQQAQLAQIEERLHRFGLTDEDVRQLNSSEGRTHRMVSRSTVTAPFAGIITNYSVTEGEVVDANRELFTLADLSTVWVQADIYEKDIAKVHRGSLAQVSVEAYPGRSFEGRVTYISDLLDPKTRTAKVRCEVPNPEDLLKLDMFATINIPTPENRKAVMVPATALQTIDDQPVLFVRSSPETFSRRNVKLSAKDGIWVEVTDGVKSGERVVTTGSFQLKALLLREKIGGEE
jgi:cobalt-zinc-cadmium efflux system membrane fusion protein